MLKAGAARIDISPPLGTHLAGDVGGYRPAEGQLDSLYASALVFESEGRRLAFLSLDVTIITQEWTDFIRAGAAGLGFEPEAVMVHATQTHSAPPMGRFMLDEDWPWPVGEAEWLWGGEAAYSQGAAEKAVEALQKAFEAMEPVELAFGSAIEGRYAHNRRAITRDGGITMPWKSWAGGARGPVWIRYIEGPMDPEVGVMAVRNGRGELAAALLHYTCHPVHIYPKQLISADWPGAWGAAFRTRCGADCVPLVANGACGNLNPWPPFDPDYVEDHLKMGEVLAERAEAALEEALYSSEGPLDWRVARLALPLREVTKAQLAWAEGILCEHPEPEWADEGHMRTTSDWIAAASLYSVFLQYQRCATLDYEIQVLRIGNLALVGLPGEPFVEGQLAIKLASPTWPTWIAHCTTQYVGYVPTAEALRRGGHEATTRYWAKLQPDALLQIVAQTSALLEGLFSKA